MANKKITALPALGATPATDDVLPIVDVSGTATTKKVTVANLVAAAPQGDLLASNNLSDVASATTSRTNLGLGTAATKAVGTADTNVIAVSSGAVDLGGNTISGFDATLNDKTDSYTLLASDAGKVVVMNKGSAVNLTVPASLGAGFTCSVVQKGAGQVTFVASSTTINNRQTHTKIAGQHGVATLISTADNVFVLAGDTAS